MAEQKIFNLEERTFKFADDVRKFIKKLPKTISNIEDAKQLARASGSVGANYIEASEALGKKDFYLHMKISRKESKESKFFLRLVDTNDDAELQKERDHLAQEAEELKLIFNKIVGSN